MFLSWLINMVSELWCCGGLVWFDWFVEVVYFDWVLVEDVLFVV